MSSKHNDQPLVHLGNYEEFFLLYIDGELSPAQVRAVDEFLLAHPDLRAELDLLNGTRLIPEPLSFPKEELLSNHMQQTVIDEDLFLYMDNELPAAQKAAVEQDLALHPGRRRQLEALRQTRLDATQTIAYPDKKELYRREERRTAFPWMRAAAVAALIGTAAVFYFHQDPAIAPAAAVATLPTRPATGEAPPPAKTTDVAATRINTGSMHHVRVAPAPAAKSAPAPADPAIHHPVQTAAPQPSENGSVARLTSVDAHMVQASAQAIEPSRIVVSTLNNSPVTSALHDRITIEDATVKNSAEAPNGNEHKGTVKGFLRKATRLIEKRTGVDPTSDGDLLIGVVAVHLK